MAGSIAWKQFGEQSFVVNLHIIVNVRGTYPWLNVHLYTCVKNAKCFDVPFANIMDITNHTTNVIQGLENPFNMHRSWAISKEKNYFQLIFINYTVTVAPQMHVD